MKYMDRKRRSPPSGVSASAHRFDGGGSQSHPCRMNGYFDGNATTPLHPAARAAWLEASDRFWHNPSSLYHGAGAARQALEDAREQVADWLGCGAEDIIFLSGATEANNAVMRHCASLGSESGTFAAAAVSRLEHPSAAEPARYEFGDRLREIPSTAAGVADLAALREMVVRDRPALVSLMAANNETGVLQPWEEALDVCREHGAAFHCDAAQWIGKMPAEDLGQCDWVTGSAHKFGGPKGIGFLKVPSGGRPLRWLRGGPQEERRRAGTENLPAVAAMVAAWAVREKELSSAENPAAALALAGRQGFEQRLHTVLPEPGIIAEHSPRLWNTVLITVPPPENVKWLVRLSALGFQVSTGSACSQGGGASEVLRAMGLATERLGQVLRLSGGWETTSADWLALADAFATVAGTISQRPPGLSTVGAAPAGLG
ncbi:MAG: aminotransferase class V-fold PLP-dependent enzyme [Verrucomicrobiaceae bacterium]|nr:MAG: aminotransferase class V-fold PLP-dependent enzyme [Verrucomicrobiaceae bacterium]